jgi:hypothetical protein
MDFVLFLDSLQFCFDLKFAMFILAGCAFKFDCFHWFFDGLTEEACQEASCPVASSFLAFLSEYCFEASPDSYRAVGSVQVDFDFVYLSPSNCLGKLYECRYELFVFESVFSREEICDVGSAFFSGIIEYGREA